MNVTRGAWLVIGGTAAALELALWLAGYPVLTRAARALSEPWQNVASWAIGFVMGHFFWCSCKEEEK